MNESAITNPQRGAALGRAVLAGMLTIVACSLDEGGQGGANPDLGENESSTAATTTPMDSSADSTTNGDDPSLGTGVDGTEGDGSTDPNTDDGATGEVCMMECPAGWECVQGECANADEGESCEPRGCGPAAPFCAPDGTCYDGSFGDPCGAGQCSAPLLCGPGGTCHGGNEGDPCTDSAQCTAAVPVCGGGACHDGSEGDPCFGPLDCSPAAALCTSGACHDGSEGDPCANPSECAGIFCGPDGACHDGSEGDPCDGPEDCGAGAPFCPYDGLCHDGSGGDPCDDGSQCTGIGFGCVGLVNKLCANI